MTALTVGAAPAADPLAGVERPRGDAGGLAALAARYEAGSSSLTSTAQGLVRTVGHVLGQAWTGVAAASCAASCLRSAEAVLVAGQAYESAGGALRLHAAKLAGAQAEYDTARRLADEAVIEERAHHQAAATAAASGVGPASFGDLVWQSPLRAVARARAEQAVADATASARQAATVLDGSVAPFRVNAPAPPEGHWYDQLTGFATGVWDGVASPAAMIGGLVGLNGDVSDNWSALASGLGHAFTHPGDFAEAVIGWDDLSHGRFGHWAGELAPTVVAAFFSGGAAAGLKGADAAAAATRAGDALDTATSVARGLPGASLKSADELTAAERAAMGAAGELPPATKVAQVLERLTGGSIRRVRNDIDFEVEWADRAYDVIRARDDLVEVHNAAKDYGFSLEDITAIKRHLFEDEHVLDRYGGTEVARFDSNPRIAEAWARLADGTPHSEDIALLRHERYELTYMERVGHHGYDEAHRAADAAGFPWDEGAAARDGLGWQLK